MSGCGSVNSTAVLLSSIDRLRAGESIVPIRPRRGRDGDLNFAAFDGPAQSGRAGGFKAWVVGLALIVQARRSVFPAGLQVVVREDDDAPNARRKNERL